MLPILFQDQRFVVVDKPAGMPCHAGRDGAPSVEDLFPAISRRPDGPWLAHRLDRDTSGCLVIALRKAALVAAQAAFADGRAAKTYWAVVAGGPDTDSGIVDAPLLKRSDRGGWRMVVDPGGRPARTAWQIRGRAPGFTWLELRPQTGRTHQVRVHCAVLGCPVFGDAIYGAGAAPLHLLARSIVLPLVPPVDAVASPPAHMLATLRVCGFG